MNLPILSKRFFEDHPPTGGFFSKWRSFATWTDELIPIYEWRGVLFVGCLKPPESFPELKAQVVFVLCEHESLKSIWYDYQGTVVASRSPAEISQVKIPSSIPEEISMDALMGHMQTDTPLKDTAGDELMLTDESDSNSANADTMIKESESEPESLDLNMDEMTKTTALESTAFILKPVPPSENTVTIATAPVTAAAKTAPAKVAPAVAKPVVAVAAKPVKEITKSDVKIETKATPQKTEVIYTKPGALSSNRAILEKNDVTSTSIAALNSTPKSKLDAFIDNVFAEMSYHYQKTMLLLKDGNTMVPWKWSEEFIPGAENSQPIPLETPSPFRIVMKTQKPYHGYIIPNDINEKFFDEWNSSQAPDHLTLAPVVVEDHVIGILLGIGDKSADNKSSLTLAEKLAEDMAKQIKSQPEYFKAA